MLFTRIILAATVCAGSGAFLLPLASFEAPPPPFRSGPLTPFVLPIVLASSSQGANIAARALHTVAKRDAADDFAAAQSIAMGLAQSAGEAVASGGKCSTECNDWVGSMGVSLLCSSYVGLIGQRGN